jgi:hypothetical protein
LIYVLSIVQPKLSGVFATEAIAKNPEQKRAAT